MEWFKSRCSKRSARSVGSERNYTWDVVRSHSKEGGMVVGETQDGSGLTSIDDKNQMCRGGW